MPKSIPSLKPRELIRILKRGGCSYYREGKGDHRLYIRGVEGKKRIVPIDIFLPRLIQFRQAQLLQVGP